MTHLTMTSAQSGGEGVPVWIKSPNESGLWWWWNEDEDSLPVPVHIQHSATNNSYFASEQQYGWNRFLPVEEMRGQWMRLIEPEVPKL